MSRFILGGLVLTGITALIALLRMVLKSGGQSSYSDSVSESVLNRIRVEYPNETR